MGRKVTPELLLKPCKACGAVDRYPANGRCKPCAHAQMKQWATENPERATEIKRRWGEKNPDKVKAANAKRRADPTVRAYENALSRAWALRNPERALANRKAWLEKNAEHDKRRAAAWRRANLERLRLKSHYRRAKKRQVGGELSRDLPARLMKLQKGKCACCRASLKKGYHMDHIVPLALGGSNADENIQLLCPKCNLSKGWKHPVEFMQRKGFLL